MLSLGNIHVTRPVDLGRWTPRTLLELAIMEGNENLVRRMILFGAESRNDKIIHGLKCCFNRDIYAEVSPSLFDLIIGMMILEEPPNRKQCADLMRMAADSFLEKFPFIERLLTMDCFIQVLHDQDEFGCTPIFHSFDDRVILLLAEYGADPDHVSFAEETPLHYLIRMALTKGWEVKREIGALIWVGADETVRNRQGMRAIDLVSPEEAQMVRNVSAYRRFMQTDIDVLWDCFRDAGSFLSRLPLEILDFIIKLVADLYDRECDLPDYYFPRVIKNPS